MRQTARTRIADRSLKPGKEKAKPGKEKAKPGKEKAKPGKEKAGNVLESSLQVRKVHGTIFQMRMTALMIQAKRVLTIILG